jgi:hypothetical protein
MSGCRMFQYLTYRMLRSQLVARSGYQQLSEIHVNVQVWNVRVWHVQVWNFEVWPLATFRCAAEFDRHRGTADKTRFKKTSVAIIGGIPEPAQKWHHVLAAKSAVDFQFRRTP